jgi:hypothetical protein
MKSELIFNFLRIQLINIYGTELREKIKNLSQEFVFSQESKITLIENLISRKFDAFV